MFKGITANAITALFRIRPSSKAARCSISTMPSNKAVGYDLNTDSATNRLKFAEVISRGCVINGGDGNSATVVMSSCHSIDVSS